MKILITGGNGQLGSELRRILAAGESELGPIPESLRGGSVTAVDLPQVDIADRDAVARVFSGGAYDLTINCAAMTNVDGCESDPETAFKANALGARNMAREVAGQGGKLIHVSTDYVFDGTGDVPRREWDEASPNTVYGKSKLLGERYVAEGCPRAFIVRTSWLYGYTGSNFVKTILKAGRQNGSLKVVSDQAGNPTNAVDLAHHLLLLAATEAYGLYHCTGNGVCSWYDFAVEFVRLAGFPCEIAPCATEEFPRPAPRPAYSALDHLALRCVVGDRMRHWKDAIAAYMAHYDKESGEITL